MKNKIKIGEYNSVKINNNEELIITDDTFLVSLTLNKNTTEDLFKFLKEYYESGNNK